MTDGCSWLMVIWDNERHVADGDRIQDVKAKQAEDSQVCLCV